MDWTRAVLIPGAVALLTAAAVTPVVRALARFLGVVARPRADRWHRKPTALLGGIGILGGLAVGFLWLWPLGGWQIGLLALCTVAMFLVGLVDDLVSLRPNAKLAAQLAVASAFLFSGIRLVYFDQPVIDLAVTLFWLVGITNALNLLDNLDGQAAGVTVIAAGFLTYFFGQAGQPTEAAITAVLVGAALGFLIYNWHPSSIFMGDCGSLMMGFLLAGVTMFNQSHRTRNLLATLMVPLLILLVPILDTALVTLARKTHGRAVSQGGTDHISHRLVALGFSERATVLVVYAVALASGLMAVFVRHLPLVLAVALVPVFFGLVWFGLMVVGRVRVYSRGEEPEPGSPALEEEGGPDAGEPAAARPRTVFAVLNMEATQQILLVIYDLLAVLFCYYVAFLLRFGSNTEPFLRSFFNTLPVVVAVQIALFWLTGLYRPMWRYGGLSDLWRIGLSVSVAVAGSVAATTFISRFQLLSRAVFLTDAVLLVGVLAIGRYVGRGARRLAQQQGRRDRLRTLVYGAGVAGDAAVRELLESGRWGLLPVGFLDDDPGKHGRLVAGFRVLGGLDHLPALAVARRIQAVVVAIQDLPPEIWEALRRQCQNHELKLRRFQLSIDEVETDPSAAEPPAKARS